MAFIIGVVLGAAVTAILLKPHASQEKRPSAPAVQTEERWRRETQNFLKYDGDEQEGE